MVQGSGGLRTTSEAQFSPRGDLSFPSPAGDSRMMKNPDSNQGKRDERTEIRETTHRVMGSRQSQKSVERSGQRRQPKTGGTGGHPKK